MKMVDKASKVPLGMLINVPVNIKEIQIPVDLIDTVYIWNVINKLRPFKDE